MIKNVLHEIPIFQNFTQYEIEELSSWMHKQNVESRTIIIKEGEPSDGLYVLARGEVEIIKETHTGPMVVTELESPSVFGEMGLMTEESRSASVRSKTAVVLGFLPATLFEKKLVERNLTALLIALNLGRIACQRLRATTINLSELAENCSRHALHMASGMIPKKTIKES